MRQGLQRYDVNSLRPISRTENPNAMVFPRISIPGDPYLHDLSMRPRMLQPSASLSPAAPPAVETILQPIQHEGQIHRGLLANPEPDEDWTGRLFNIQEIGISRFVYILKKYPAVILIFVGAWILWGRGWNTELLKDVEKNMGISGMVTGLVSAAGVIFTSQHHANDKSAAKTQTMLRMGVSVLNLVFAITVIVFGIIAVSNIHNDNPKEIPLPSFTLNERTAHAGTMIGLGLLTAVFAMLSLLFGWQGLGKVHSEEKKIKNIRRRIPLAGYTDTGMYLDE